jgi:8-oxo-dGTP diphosphatase
MEPDKCEEWKWVTWEEIETLAQAQTAAEQAETKHPVKFDSDYQLFKPILDLFGGRKKFHPWREYRTVESEPV